MYGWRSHSEVVLDFLWIPYLLFMRLFLTLPIKDIEKDATEKVGLYRRKNLEIIHRILLILANQLSC